MLGSMLGDAETTDALVADELLADLLQAADEKTVEANQRQGSRSTHQSAITIEPSSTSQRGVNCIEGHLRDAGSGGVGALTKRPPQVGDVYLLTFHNSPFETDQVFGRCMHCRLIQEDAFESGFAFFASTTLREEQV